MFGDMKAMEKMYEAHREQMRTDPEYRKRYREWEKQFPAVKNIINEIPLNINEEGTVGAELIMMTNAEIIASNIADTIRKIDNTVDKDNEQIATELVKQLNDLELWNAFMDLSDILSLCRQKG